MIYRYLLHLESPERQRILRWTFAHPVFENETFELPTLGRWYVTRALTDNDPGADVLYCTPA